MKTEIIEGNKLIAEFMGMKHLATHFDSHNYEQYSYNVPNDLSEKVFGYIGAEVYLEKQFMTWDWLMPVIDKIEDIGFRVYIEKGGGTVHYCKIKCAGKIVGVCDFISNTSKIQATFGCIIEFINWYNSPTIKKDI